MWLGRSWVKLGGSLVMIRMWLCLVGLWLAAPAAAVVGGAPAAPPEPDSAVVFVQKHGLSARLEGIKDDRLGYYSFFGIRYAEPPVGGRRFQRPVRRHLAGELNATQHCWPCPQPDPRDPRRVLGSEDCLCLNVYAPKMPGEEEGCPVIFFIHGGNYKSGSTTAYGGQHFTKKDTILVSAQYRLGSLGYFSTGNRDASGNAGLFDMRAALAWINDYIEFFGGDPSRVVIMGQGSGGSAASLLALSSEGRSAKGVVALSGTPLSPGAVHSDPEKVAKELANKTNCPSEPPERLLKCLRQLPMEKIVLAEKDISSSMVNTKKFLEDISGRSGAGARVEGEHDQRSLPPLVAEDPSDSLNKKRQPGPLLTGVTSAETSRAVFGKYSKFLSERLASVKDFIKTELIGGLRGVVKDVHGLIPLSSAVSGILPLEDYYQALFDNSLSAVDGLAQIAEATGDALFNFPAYQSVRAWGAAAASPAYLYSFEHVGNLTRGAHFLPGVPLADERSNDNSPEQRSGKTNGPAHGDELAYLFEPLDDSGRPLGGEVSSTDAQVRDNFVGLVAKFAHEFQPIGSAGASNKTKLPSLLPFSKDNEQYIKIKDQISLDKNFRFCQMGLWGNMGDRVSGAICKDLLGSLLNLPKLPVRVPPVPVPVPTALPMVPPRLPGLGLVGSRPSQGAAGPGPTMRPSLEVQPRRTTQRPRRNMLGLIDGL